MNASTISIRGSTIFLIPFTQRSANSDADIRFWNIYNANIKIRVIITPLCISTSQMIVAAIKHMIGRKKFHTLGFSGIGIASSPACISIDSDPGGASGPPFATLSSAFFIGPKIGIIP